MAFEDRRCHDHRLAMKVLCGCKTIVHVDCSIQQRRVESRTTAVIVVDSTSCLTLWL